MVRRLVLALALGLPCTAALAAENLISGGDFESGLKGWSPIWSRDSSAKATVVTDMTHGGRQAVRIEHTGARDWSLGQSRALDVEPGQIIVLSGWVKVQGKGRATLSVILRDREKKVLDWSFAEQSPKAGVEGWQLVRSKFAVPPGVATIEARLTGDSPITVWLDDVSLEKAGTLAGLRSGPLAKSLTLSNKAIEVVFTPADATFAVTDLRGKRTWRQRPGTSMFVGDAQKSAEGLRLKLLDPISMREIAVSVRLESDRPEFVVELAGSSELNAPVEYPLPFATEKGETLVLPVNEGIAYPVDDMTLSPMSYILYGGHGLCMPWYGMVEESGRGVLTIVETPDDANVRIPRLNGLLHLTPTWTSQKGQFGPARRVRYAFLADGGYVAMAKRYRQFAKDTGLFKTLAEKRSANPNVDRLIGAVNVWCYDRDPAGMVREMQGAGVGRILWSSQAKPEAIRQMNALGALTSRYDVYQDLMDPAVFPKLSGIHPDWTTEGWPKDIIIKADGQVAHGWAVKGKDGQWYDCAVLCDRQAVEYARRRISAELKTHPYECRFIDTTTAAPWNECYSPSHPMTRTESRKFKMELLRVVSEENHLVTGSETGHDAAVPVVHYFEGMLSLGPYRIPDAGRNTAQIVTDVPERVAKFQTGHFYRLPLWELVYHECVVADWYWGDYNNKMPSLWDRRDLWNALYGTPPMFMLDRKQWNNQRARFVKSYQDATTVARATGYSEMVSHRWLTRDHAVQETQFANGVVVTVNFGDVVYKLGDGTSLEGMRQLVKGLGARGGN